MRSKEESGDQSYASVCAFLASCCFLIHPLNAEVVAWASAAPYTHAALFVWLCIALELSEQSVSDIAANRVSWRISAAQCAAYICGFLLKSVVTPLPAALACMSFAIRFSQFSAIRRQTEPNKDDAEPDQSYSYDCIFKTAFNSIRRHMMLFAVCAASVPLTVAMNAVTERSQTDLIVLSGFQHVVLACYRFLHYAFSAVAPLQLRAHYRIPDGWLDVLSTSNFDSPHIPFAFRNGSQSIVYENGLVVTPDMCIFGAHSRLSPTAYGGVWLAAFAVFLMWCIAYARLYPIVLAACAAYAVMLLPVSSRSMITAAMTHIRRYLGSFSMV